MGERQVGSTLEASPDSRRRVPPYSRQRDFVVAQVVKNIVVAGVCGVIFFLQGHQTVTKVFSNSSFNVSSLWYFCMLYTILSCLQIIPQLFFFKVSQARLGFSGARVCNPRRPFSVHALFPHQVLYTRERSANVYSTFAYWASHAVVSLPLLLAAHIGFVEVAYWLVGGWTWRVLKVQSRDGTV